jgi:hypothetical protein
MAHDQPPDWIAAELRRAAVTERAPAQLRRRVEQLSRPQRRGPSRRLALAGATGLLAAAVAVLALVLGGGTPGGLLGGPTVAQAAGVGAQPIIYSPPAGSSAALAQAYAGFGNVRIPGALDHGAWSFAAWRVARLDGRRILTIYYTRGSQELAYVVAASPRLRGQKSGFTSFVADERTVVSWQESNHSCLLSSAQVPRPTLVALARS